MKSFVIVVDVQRDFMCADGALPVPGAEALIAPTNDWLAARSPAETQGSLFTFDTHLPEVYAGSAEAELFPPHCVRGSAGWESVLRTDRVDPLIPLYRLEKPVFDMWAETALVEPLDRADGAGVPRDQFFEQLKASGVEQVTVIGVAADYCVRWAIDGLLAQGFAVEVPTRLTRGIDRQIEAVGREAFEGRGLVLA